MARRRIGQEQLSLGADQRRRRGSLNEIAALYDWIEIDRVLAPVYAAAKGEQAWPPLALFKALLLAVWYDLSDVKLAEALEDRASFRRFCGFATHEPTPERTAFVRFRRELVTRCLDRDLRRAMALMRVQAACPRDDSARSTRTGSKTAQVDHLSTRQARSAARNPLLQVRNDLPRKGLHIPRAFIFDRHEPTRASRLR